METKVGHCVKCKEKREILNPYEKRSETGRLMLQGKCTVCSTKMTTFIKDPSKPAKEKKSKEKKEPVVQTEDPVGPTVELEKKKKKKKTVVESVVEETVPPQVEEPVVPKEPVVEKKKKKTVVESVVQDTVPPQVEEPVGPEEPVVEKKKKKKSKKHKETSDSD